MSNTQLKLHQIWNTNKPSSSNSACTSISVENGINLSPSSIITPPSSSSIAPSPSLNSPSASFSAKNVINLLQSPSLIVTPSSSSSNTALSPSPIITPSSLSSTAPSPSPIITSSSSISFAAKNGINLLQSPSLITTSSSSSSITPSSSSIVTSSLSASFSAKNGINLPQSPVLSVSPSSSSSIAILSSSIITPSSSLAVLADSMCDIEILSEIVCPSPPQGVRPANKNDTTNCNNTEQQITTATTSTHRTHYLFGWEKKAEAFYKTYVFDDSGNRHEKFVCWLTLKDGRMYCSLCQLHKMRENTNGKDNLWCTDGYKTFAFDKIKQHKNKNEVHKRAEALELTKTDGRQPPWLTAQSKEIDKHERAIQNMMFSCIYICQEDLPLNNIEPVYVLLEKLGVQLLPAQVSGVSYRNNDAALNFIQHIASYLHEEIIEKVQASSVIGWMMDESTSRTVEKSCIVYVRYLENYQAKTSFYALMDMEGDGTATNIVENISNIWRKDDISAINTCWFAADNASTFTGVHEGVVAKLRRQLQADWLEVNTCCAHSFALVGNQGSYTSKLDHNKKPIICESIARLEELIGKIYTYFGRSSGRQQKLKAWRNFLDMPELKFKRIFDIRWSSIRGCIRPIVENIEPGYQALLACLQQASSDLNSTNVDRQLSKDLLTSILDDNFLFLLYFHHDLHEIVLGPITKQMQHDHLSYFTLMETINEKREILKSWASQSTLKMGPTLSDYIQLTEKGSFGSFKITTGDRQQLFNDCHAHIQRLFRELDRRFSPSKLHENLSVLFDPHYLIKNRKNVASLDYGRLELDFLRGKYRNLGGFNSNVVRSEWESFKQPLSDYLNMSKINHSEKTFWQDFICLKQSINSQFDDAHKNVLLLLGVYLISPTNSAECERGFSAANRIQTSGRSRLMISTLEVLMNVRLLLTDDLRSPRCQQIVNRSFQSWNDSENNRRMHRVKLLIDVPDDFEPAKRTHSAVKRKRSSIRSTSVNRQSKKIKSKAIKCANGCKTDVSDADPTQREAIQCCHQNDQFDWLEVEDNCSRWLCNGCRIKIGVTTESVWFCSDHVEMHSDDEEDENDE